MPFLDVCNSRRFLILLGMLLMLLVVQPLFSGFGASVVWFDGFFLLVVVALLFSLSQEKTWRIVAYVIGVPAALLSVAGHLVSEPAYGSVLLVGHLLGAVVVVIGIGVIVRSIIAGQNLTLDSLFGVVCGYLLLGVAWGLLNGAVDTIWPGSFAMREELAEYAEQSRSRTHLLVYYSFVTLTTVGYGDITPISPQARTLAWVEAMTGQLYLAVLVAGLVGALINKKREQSG